ncbi:MAG: hypothetical protein Q9213_002443 [Squamulea squamosa]
MSQYLNSFLIEPVVRQARRFSRPGHNDRPLHNDDIQPSSDDRAEIHLWDERESWVHAEAIEPPSRQQLTFDRLAPQATDTAAAESNATPQHPEGSLDLEARAWRNIHRPPEMSHEQSLAPATGPDSAPPNSQISSNPVHSASESLRSTNSSLSDSVHLATHPDALEVQDSEGPSLRYPRAANNLPVQAGDGTLPEDDGMAMMRRRIVAIHRTDSSNTEKAQMVHKLMTESYSSSQASLQAPLLPPPPSPAKLNDYEKQTAPMSGHTRHNSAECTSPPTTLSPNVDANNLFNLSAEDLEPTYYQRPRIQQSNAAPENRSSDRLSQDFTEGFKLLGCPHYKRNIKLQCSACYRWYTCRFCHDEVEDHLLNRHETKNMLCMLCACVQPASGKCVQCGEYSARYYCGVCKLWDNDPGKHIYHCNDCGICRIGQGLGKDFFHCKTCCACLSMRTLENHRCIERSTDCDCPICGEYMFTSPQTVVFMRCGHSIHHRCYYEHVKRSYKCPICSKSMYNMEAQFRHLERSIESQPMPPEFQDTKAWVYCNDCNAKSSVKYHWMGLKCGVCDSYNTASLQIIRDNNPRSIHDDTGERSPNSQTRGRATDINTQAQRVTNSAPPSAVVVPADELSRRSAEPQSQQGFSQEVAVTDEDRHSAEAFLDEEHSDVDFWGLESPSARGQSIPSHDNPQNPNRDEDNSQDDLSDNDNTASCEVDEDDEEDQMEIFGHR